jgi:hypothetical protein
MRSVHPLHRSVDAQEIPASSLGARWLSRAPCGRDGAVFDADASAQFGLTCRVVWVSEGFHREVGPSGRAARPDFRGSPTPRRSTCQTGHLAALGSQPVDTTGSPRNAASLTRRGTDAD